LAGARAGVVRRRAAAWDAARKEDLKRKCTRNTQMVRSGSQVLDDAFHLQAGIAEIEQQAEMQASRLEVVGALQAMHIIQRFLSICA
jgi:hypothetical protein